MIDARSVAKRRKRLGQFFSGVRLGRLLAGLTNVQQARSIIDPMVGSGDLLQACLELGAKPELMVGIELDDRAASFAVRRLPGACVIAGDAFAPNTIASLPNLSYDLVIANPPYVRYQDGSKADGEIPAATAVREGLIAAADSYISVDRSHATLIRSLARDYSGLADLAVPACLLSMLMTAPGGELALILPQSWLARDYALPIRFALETLFDPIAVIEDEDATWFEDALVRTTLIVAQRTHPSVGLRRQRPAPVHLRLASQLADSRSLVGRIAPAGNHPEILFGDLVRSNSEEAAELLRDAGVHVRMLTGLNHLRHSPDGSSNAILPKELDDLLEDKTRDLVELDSFPVTVGQGLRTGANDFFYVQASDRGSCCRVSPELGRTSIEGVNGLLRPAVRDQRADAMRTAQHWQDAILDLREVALPEDLEGAGPATRSAYRTMPIALADHVRRAADALSGKPGREKPISKLSAVVTNVRAERAGRPARFWYQLPDIQPRHQPDVYLPRINAGRPRAIVNRGRFNLVDANFITFICEDGYPPEALAAMLNSDWAWAYLELTGAVMGAGALKIESTMLRRMPFPALAGEAGNAPYDTDGVEKLFINWLGPDAVRVVGETARARCAARSRRNLRVAA